MVTDGEIETSDPLGLLTPGIAITAGLILLLLFCMAVVLLWVAVRRARRAQLGTNGRLALRMVTGDRSARALTAQRYRLRREMRATNEALAGAAGAHSETGDLSHIAATLSRTARHLDNQLRTAAHDPSQAVRQQASTDLAPKVEQTANVASQIRQQLARLEMAVATDELEQARTRIDGEVQALDTWVSTYQRLHRA
ncbi:hypothetical protein ACFUC1_01475 [Pedococcus sp. NPDC057267]|uniref:hypothetical protein n=1 Tax=Pedococcus sp. NPDC057267 TaxID=3346077 RepID=UPI0036443560